MTGKREKLGSSMSNTRQRLLQAFKERAVSFGKFTLASGKESTYYINSKKAIFQSEVVGLLGDVLFEMTKDLDINAAGAGAKVVSVVCIVDRLEGARAALASYDFRPIFTIRDFGIEPPP